MSFLITDDAEYCVGQDIGKNSGGDVSTPHRLALPPIYLNITLLNKDTVVAEKVQEKTGNRVLLGKVVAWGASKLITDETIINKLAATLSEKVPEAIAEMGITAQVSKKFQHKSFVVLQVQVTDVDKLSLLLAAKGQEYASTFTQLLSSLHRLELTAALQTIDEKIGDKIMDSLISKMASIIPEKVGKAGLEISCDVLKREDEAEYFFEVMGKIQQ